MKIRLPFWGSLSLGLVLFYLFLLWQFPYEGLRRSIIQNFEEKFPLTLSVGRAGPSFPVGLRIENVRLSSDSISFRVPDLKITPNLPGFSLRRSEWLIRGADLPPRIEGRIRRDRGNWRLDLRLNQVEVQAASPEEFSFSLNLSGEISFQCSGDDWEKGSGQAWALVKRGELQGNRISRAPFPVTLFDTLRAEIRLEDKTVRVKRLEASGKETKFSLPPGLEFPVKGGIPADLGIFFRPPGK
jgi:type II secretion system protein N